MKDDDCLFLKRDGRLEETYFSWSIIPLVGEDGSGMYSMSRGSSLKYSSWRIIVTLLTCRFKLLAFTTLRSTKRAAELRSGGC
jgi:hypothetical protein